MTGRHALSGVNVTGLVTGSATEFVFFTGFSNFNLNIPTTGEYLSKIIAGNRNFLHKKNKIDEIYIKKVLSKII